MLPAFKDEYLVLNFKKLIKKHDLKRLFETGTWNGISCGIASEYIDEVHTVEINRDLVRKARDRNRDNPSITVYEGSSPVIMNEVLQDNDTGWIFFLDAHWHQDWPILEELEVIANKHLKPVIMIHDFYVPNGSGGARFRYDSYDGQDLDYGFIKKSLEKIYGPEGYTYYYSEEIGCVDSALIYIEPVLNKPIKKYVDKISRFWKQSFRNRH